MLQKVWDKVEYIIRLWFQHFQLFLRFFHLYPKKIQSLTTDDQRKNRQIQEMDSAQKKFEAKAAQFREISTKMRRGMVNAMRNGELERLVGEMTEVLETQARSGGWNGSVFVDVFSIFFLDEKQWKA